jgi:hypothetical protein
MEIVDRNGNCLLPRFRQFVEFQTIQKNMALLGDVVI